MFPAHIEICLLTLVVAQVASVVCFWRAFRGAFRLRRQVAVERAERHGDRHALRTAHHDLDARVTRLESGRSMCAMPRTSEPSASRESAGLKSFPNSAARSSKACFCKRAALSSCPSVAQA